MGDTVSDQDTFVSVDNFITSADATHPQGDEESGVTDHGELNTEDYLNENTGAQGSSSAYDRASFVWTMFSGNGNESQVDNEYDHHELDGDTMNSRRQSQMEQAPDSDNDDSLTDASDLCVEIDDSSHGGSGRPSQVTVRSIASPLPVHRDSLLQSSVFEQSDAGHDHDLNSTQLSLPDEDQHTLLYVDEEQGNSVHSDLMPHGAGEYESGNGDIVDQNEEQATPSQQPVRALYSTPHRGPSGTPAVMWDIEHVSQDYGPLSGGNASSRNETPHTSHGNPTPGSRGRQFFSSGDQAVESLLPSRSGRGPSDLAQDSVTPAVQERKNEASNHNLYAQADSANRPNNVDQDQSKLYEDESSRLFNAASGMTSFQVENPFSTSPDDNPETSSRLTLFSKQGGLSAAERSALELFGLNMESAESTLVSKLIETIVFQREQMTQYKITAAELGGTALHSESVRFSELERRRSIAMNALVTELDSERIRMSDLAEENEKLKGMLRALEEQQDGVISYCKQYNPRFSFSSGVEAALEEIFVQAQDVRRQSARQVEAQNAQLEDLASRVIKLDGLLSESRERYEEVQTENAQLRRQLSVLEGASTGPAQSSPELSGRSPVDVDAAVRERDNLLQKVDEQSFQLDTLRQSLTRVSEEKEKVDDALLALNVEVEMGRSKISTLQEQRDTAERNCRETDKLRNAEKKKYHDMAQEFSDDIVAAVHDLDAKDVEIRLLRREIEDRESVVRSLQVTVSEIEGQLQNLTDAAIEKGSSQRRSSGSSRRQVSAVLDTVVKNLRLDLERAQSLLSQRSAELNVLRKKITKQDESIVTLQRECDHYRAIAAVKENAPHLLNPEQHSEQQNSFLNRLSEKLGIHSENNHELVGKLVSRVEQLMKDRSLYESNIDNMRQEVVERERKLHVVRSEMIAEITTLKAEVQHLENLNERANQECRFAEKKLLEVLGERDTSRHDSVGDITSSSLGLRRESGFEDGESRSRRESFFSVLGSDNTIQWNDPLVTAAVQSLNDLIEMKESLSARVRALDEKFDRMMKRNKDVSDNEMRELMIESREIQGDLSGVLNMQQGIIDKLRPDRHVSSNPVPGAEDSLPYMQGGGLIDREPETGELLSEGIARSRLHPGIEHAPPSSVDGFGEAAGFLRDQLRQTRDLYNEKSKANAQLCGVVAELRQELDHVGNEKKATEDLVRELSENHRAFVTRLAETTGTEPSVVAIEDFVQAVVHDLSRLSEELSFKSRGFMFLHGKALALLAQKRLLTYMIHTYQSKYQLDILLPTPEEAASAKRRFKTSALVVLACLRFSRVSEGVSDRVEEIDVSREFNVPRLMPLVKPNTDGLTLINASLAISAVPRLETALIEREKQIYELKSAIAALDQTSGRTGHDETRASVETSFAYNEDLMNRKDDLARRLRKAMKEKADLELQYSREREVRLATEAKLARYSERLSAAKKKLSRANAQADSKERTYKAAIKYLKHKADKAVENKVNMDENINPWASPLSAQRQESGKPKILDEEEPSTKSLTVLHEQLARSEDNIKKFEAGSSEYDDLSKYIYGLRKAIQRLKHPRRPQPQAPSVVDSNLATEAQLG